MNLAFRDSVAQDARQFWLKSQRDMLFTQATALAYTTLVSLVPLLAVGFFLFQAFGGLETLMDKLEPLIEQNLAPSFGTTLSTYLDKFVSNAHAGTVGALGVIGFIFTSVSTLMTIERTLNRVWGVTRQRGLAMRMTTYWSALTMGPLLLAVSLGMSSKALMWLKNDNGAISHVLVWIAALVPYVLSGGLFAALFFFLPNVPVSKKAALKAGGLTGVVFEIAKLIYAAYATHALASNAVYGSLAVFPVFLLWLYVVWLIVLFGAEFCCYLQYKEWGIPYHFSSVSRLNPFLIADVLDTLTVSALQPKSGVTPSDLLIKLRVSIEELNDHLDFLESEGWIVSSNESILGVRSYHLAVQKEAIDMARILKQLEGHRYVPRSSAAVAVFERQKNSWRSSEEPKTH